MTWFSKIFDLDITDSEFEETRKDFFDDYTPSERRAMELEDAQNYNEHISCACFWTSTNEYQDYFGDWRLLDDTTAKPERGPI